MEKITVYSDALGGVEKLRGVAATWWSFGVSTCALALSRHGSKVEGAFQGCRKELQADVLVLDGF